jgi:hypothetical protein
MPAGSRHHVSHRNPRPGPSGGTQGAGKHSCVMFSDKETLIAETCLLLAVPISVGISILSALFLLA